VPDVGAESGHVVCSIHYAFRTSKRILWLRWVNLPRGPG
jgi:hypothetical protein